VGLPNINVVIGNHSSNWGITSILQVLKRDLLADNPNSFSFYPKENVVNIFIEDFHSSKYVRAISGMSQTINVLIMTEFYRDFRGMKFLNTFISLRSMRSIVQIFTESIIFRYSKHSAYWRRRKRNLDKLLKSGYFAYAIQLHPESFSWKTKYDLGLDVLYPTITNLDLDQLNVKLPKLITFGSDSQFRRKQRHKFHKNLPMHIERLSFETLENSKTRKDFNLVDVYFRNSSPWKYTSPIRISASTSIGIPVILIDNLDNHPITKCCLCLGFNDLSKIDQIFQSTLGENSIKFNVEIQNYNTYAKAKNTAIKNKIVALSSRSLEKPNH
jgi:hypothetical protein